LEDPETGDRIVVDTSDREFRDAFRDGTERSRAKLDRDFRRCQVDVIDIQTGEPYVEPLMRFFKKRMRRLR